MKKEDKKTKRERRHRRIRKKIFGTKARPRFLVFKSNLHIYAQLINDEEEKTLLSCSDLEIKNEKKEGKTEVAKKIGQLFAQKAKEKGINQVVFDRGGFRYMGRVKSLAEGAREGGLIF